MLRGRACAQHLDAEEEPVPMPLKPEQMTASTLPSGGGLDRNIATTVGGFSTALALAKTSDLIASVPERHTASLRAGMHSFRLPVSVPEFAISMLWHPRLDADAAHRWLRGCIREVCAERFIQSSSRRKAAVG